MCHAGDSHNSDMKMFRTVEESFISFCIDNGDQMKLIRTSFRFQTFAVEIFFWKCRRTVHKAIKITTGDSDFD